MIKGKKTNSQRSCVTPKIKSGCCGQAVCAAWRGGMPGADSTVKAIAGGENTGGGNSIGGMEISKEVSIIARGVYSGNGGWL